MAVLIRERETSVAGVEVVVERYRSTRPPGASAVAAANALDKELRENMRSIVREVDQEGWLRLRRRPGVVRLWWEVGRRIRMFVDDIHVDPPEDRVLLWRAMYDHAPELVPGELSARSTRGGSNLFLYCYYLGEYDWPTVKAFGDWTSWVEVFDSPVIASDPRIARWLIRGVASREGAWSALVSVNRADWFRPLAKRIRSLLRHRDSTVLSDDELRAELDGLLTT